MLIGSFWASFTLIAYPTVAKYGLTKTRSVAAVVGASAITDTVSLVVLALIVGAETGDAFFIPTFLISVGLLFDPEVMFVWSTIRLALGFSVALIVGKAIAAWLTGRFFGLDTAEVGLLFSISVAQAAATLAATVIGFDIGLYSSDVVLAVIHNPETSSASVVSPMNLPVGRSLGARHLCSSRSSRSSA